MQPSQSAPPAPGGATIPVQGVAQPAPAPASGPSPGGGGGGMLFTLVLLAPMILILLWTSRSQKKKQQQLEGKLKKGDRVATQSGLIGKLVEFGDARHVRIEIAPGVKVTMLRSAIAGVESDDKGKDEAGTGEKK
jgi:preprotein translocase subunit YajC